MTTFNAMQSVKRQFFALRNGVIADLIRRSNGNYKIIFGLNLPQLVEIASSIGTDEKLADSLWENRTTRESMMLAPMIVSPETFPYEKAKQWAMEVPTHEVADILCHRLLRHTPYALDLAEDLYESETALNRYVAIRLLFNLLPASADKAHEICNREIERDNKETLSITRQLLEELEFFQ